MAHVIEPASSARAKCRGCGARIDKDTLRLGERLPNPFGEGDLTRWFHLPCAAYKNPAPLLEALETARDVEIEDRDRLEAEARRSIEHRRLPRIDGAERAASGRARCRGCRDSIEKDAWRVRLVFYEDGRFQPGGFVHARCAREYFGTAELIDRIRHFSPQLSVEEVEGFRSELS